MPEWDTADFRPVQRESPASRIIVGVLIAAAIGAGGWWWYSTQRQQQPAPVAATPAVTAAPVEDEPAQPPAQVATGPLFPIEPQPAEAAPPADPDAQMTQLLNALLGQQAVSSFLQVDGFTRRVVATVDNLTREQATTRMWPVQPTPQRFSVAGEGGSQHIAADNAKRYAPFVAFAETLDTRKAVALYVKLYPRFQQAYEELGYPKGYFNDRLVAVLDHLLQAPEPAAPPQVKLTEVKGEYPSAQPWTRYEFADPQLESLSAGQKMMVRMGAANEKRLKAKLAEFRKRVAAGVVPKG
ncbi:DUF3014 domain-containing protein [Variovorax sp. dw_308]|uniref:DUF3014 domain-containing protein n=1 Tax=Variovorax sp. dw_308 TaxID=2721546 RepID=UPI001C46188D|nr:DUF3014 domain-containing protein [Variovorax sp. dw_308]